jgi:hypothetical protein
MFLLFITNLFAKDYNIDNFDKFADWQNQKPKQILICNDNEIKKELIKNSLAFWNQYFEAYKGIVIKSMDCSNSMNYIENSIVITKKRIPNNEEFFHGATYFLYENDLINSVRIEINLDYKDSQNLFIHELGHAIGIDHETVNQKHIMHPDCDLY